MKTVYILGGLDGWLNTMVGGKQAYGPVTGFFPTAFDTREEALASPEAQYRQFVYTMTQEEIRPTEQEVVEAKAPKPRRHSRKNAYEHAKMILEGAAKSPGNEFMWHFVNVTNQRRGNWNYLTLTTRTMCPC
jgi:hypothetical protein